MLLGSYRDSKGRAKLDDLWRKVIRLRSQTCEMCDSARAEEAAHFIGRGRGNYLTRWHPNNGNMMCRRCHRRYDEQMTDAEKRVWKRLTDGLDVVVALTALNQSSGHVDTDAIHAELVWRLEKEQ